MLLAIAILAFVIGACVLIGTCAALEYEDSPILKTCLIIASSLVIVASIILTVWWTNTESGSRAIKSWNSDISGGLQRSVEVYDQNGKLIKTYEGKFDVEANEYGNKVLFDLDGKRTVIYNATVIVQEK